MRDEGIPDSSGAGIIRIHSYCQPWGIFQLEKGKFVVIKFGTGNAFKLQCAAHTQRNVVPDGAKTHIGIGQLWDEAAGFTGVHQEGKNIHILPRKAKTHILERS